LNSEKPKTTVNFENHQENHHDGGGLCSRRNFLLRDEDLKSVWHPEHTHKSKPTQKFRHGEEEEPKAYFNGA